MPEDKCTVVYNAVELPDRDTLQMEPIKHTEKIVLFLGRVTMQKGPEYFLEAAKKVVEKYTNVRFVMAGSGDMIAQCVRQVADLKLGRYVTFTGFLRGKTSTGSSTWPTCTSCPASPSRSASPRWRP